MDIRLNMFNVFENTHMGINALGIEDSKSGLRLKSKTLNSEFRSEAIRVPNSTLAPNPSTAKIMKTIARAVTPFGL